MKLKLNYLAFLLLMSIAFSSCKNDSISEQDFIEAQKKIDQELAAQFEAEKILIENYVDTAFGSLAVEDTVTVQFEYINKIIKRGYWYEILSPATNNDYVYKGQILYSNYGPYFAPILPKVKLQYTAKNIKGIIVQADTIEGGTVYDLNAPNSTVINSVWRTTILPYIIKFNSENQRVKGFTSTGLQEGNKIRVITPSYWAFGKNAQGSIPANSILIYEFTIIDIK